MNIVAIITGIILIVIAALSVFMSFRCLKYLDYDISVMSATTFICGIVVILAGIFFR